MTLAKVNPKGFVFYFSREAFSPRNFLPLKYTAGPQSPSNSKVTDNEALLQNSCVVKKYSNVRKYSNITYRIIFENKLFCVGKRKIEADFLFYKRKNDGIEISDLNFDEKY